MKETKHGNIQRHNGSALAVSLVILLVLTILGVNSMSSLVLEERMAGHARQSMVASQATQATLRAAETWVQANINSTANLNLFRNGSLGLYSPHIAPLLVPAFDVTVDANWLANGVPVLLQGIIPPGAKAQLVGQNPRYIIEYLGQTDEPISDPSQPPPINPFPHAFRITAIGWGEDINARFLAQSTYQKEL